MMKVFGKCSVLLFGLMLFFGNNDSCYGMEISDQNKDISDQNKDSFWGYVFSSRCWNHKQRGINKVYELNFWAFIDILRHNCGFYLKRKKLKYGEWFLGSSIGIGWYPQFLNFHKHFRIGFFEAQYNFLSLITYIVKNIFNSPVNDKFGSFIVTLVPPINISIINFQIYNGLIKLRFFDIGFIYFFLNEISETQDEYFFNKGGSAEFGARNVFACDLETPPFWNIFLPDIYIDLSKYV